MEEFCLTSVNKTNTRQCLRLMPRFVLVLEQDYPFKDTECQFYATYYFLITEEFCLTSVDKTNTRQRLRLMPRGLRLPASRSKTRTA